LHRMKLPALVSPVQQTHPLGSFRQARFESTLLQMHTGSRKSAAIAKKIR